MNAANSRRVRGLSPRIETPHPILASPKPMQSIGVLKERRPEAAYGSPSPTRGEGKELLLALVDREHLQRRRIRFDAQRVGSEQADFVQRRLLEVAAQNRPA